jgi:hypothetical protein
LSAKQKDLSLSGEEHPDARLEEEHPHSQSAVSIHVAIHEKVKEHTNAALGKMTYDPQKAISFGDAYLKDEQEQVTQDPRLQYSHMYQEEKSHEIVRYKIKRSYETRKEQRATTAESNVRRVQRLVSVL